MSMSAKESIQIVRPILPHEHMPVYATVDLIMPSFCHVAFSPDSKTMREMAHFKANICSKNHDLIVKWIDERKSRPEMAEALGIHDRTVSKYIQENKLSSGLKPLKIKAKINKPRVLMINTYNARIEAIKRMVSEGRKAIQISQELGVSRDTVNRTVRKFGLTPPGRRSKTIRLFSVKGDEIRQYCKQHGFCKAANKYGTTYTTMRRFVEGGK
jgi:DNA-binding CsgD family transcriptional regulator